MLNGPWAGLADSVELLVLEFCVSTVFADLSDRAVSSYGVMQTLWVSYSYPNKTNEARTGVCPRARVRTRENQDAD
jgi:hypothetical protein